MVGYPRHWNLFAPVIPRTHELYPLNQKVGCYFDLAFFTYGQELLLRIHLFMKRYTFTKLL